MNTFLPWTILHLDLSHGIPNLPADPAAQGIYLVCWWRGIPIGQQRITSEQLPMLASQLASLILPFITPVVSDRLAEIFQGSSATSIDIPTDSHQTTSAFTTITSLQHPLTTLEQQLIAELKATDRSSIAVIICTRDRPQQLASCLQSLQNLSVPPQQIIVVDNAPSNNATRCLVEQIPQIQYVLEPEPGLSVARNTGLRHCQAEIVVFTDDDVTVQPDWLQWIQYGFNCPQVMAVTGLILPVELETESQVVFEMEQGCLSGSYQSKTFDPFFFQTNQAQGVPVWKIGAGANMAFRRKIFDLVGEFDQRLGAGASGCSEDSEFWYRVLASGWHCRYEPAAVVYHRHRRDLTSLNQQMYQYMRGHVVALLLQFEKHHHWGNLYRLFFDLPKHYLGMAIGRLIYGSRPKYITLKSEILGCLAGIFFYFKHRLFY